MDFTSVLVLIIVLMIILFSSGITILSPAHLECIRIFGQRRSLAGRIAGWAHCAITVAGRIRRAWIRMISPGSETNS